MGNSESDLFGGKLSPSEIEYYSNKTHFNSKQVIQLMRKYYEMVDRYSALDKIEPKAFIEKMNIINPLIGKIQYRMLDTKGNNSINFKRFILGLDAFLPQSPIDRKIKMCFNAYDQDGNGTISKDEVAEIIRIASDGNTFLRLSKSEVQALLDDLFKEYARTLKDDMTYEEFASMIRRSPSILECFEYDMNYIFQQ